MAAKRFQTRTEEIEQLLRRQKLKICKRSFQRSFNICDLN